ncbi:MAG: tetratricopeptide repeat protein, partial [Nitrospina sp.]|nr:tetratricopeptide repeat protein [Nitrospina sp.]
MWVKVSIIFVALVTYWGYWLVQEKHKNTQSFTFNERGNILSELRRYDEAIENYQQAILIKVNYSSAYNNLANAQKQKGQLGKSIVNYKLAIHFNNDHTDAYSNLGVVLSEQGKF